MSRALFFYIGDVSDKGVPASLIMAMTMVAHETREPATGHHARRAS